MKGDERRGVTKRKREIPGFVEGRLEGCNNFDLQQQTFLYPIPEEKLDSR